MIKLKTILSGHQYIRTLSQIFWAVVVLWIGWEFHNFINFISAGNEGQYYRPPGVEAFLPISSLMNIYYFILSGNIHYFHPAGLFIMIGILLVSFLIGKSFCGWICPIGFLSETIGEFSNKIYNRFFGRVPKLPGIIDYPLRLIKYILLSFFIYIIFFVMDTESLKKFLDSDYNLMSDIKMYLFFAEISQFTLLVIAFLFIMSVFIRNFWCRYLCPYGALLGFLGLFSPNRITRNSNSCIDCKKCNKICPSQINITNLKTVFSDECLSCFQCIDSCPVNNTLTLKNKFLNIKLNSKIITAIIFLTFITIIFIAIASNNWSNRISSKVYIEKYKHVHSLSHPTSAKDARDFKKK